MGAGATVAVSVTVAPATAGFGAAVSVVVVLVLPAVIVSVTTLDVDAANPALPPYTAVISCVPAAKLVVVNVATPEPFGVALPICVPEPHALTCGRTTRACAPRIASGPPLPASQKYTVPTGEPVGLGEIVAVNVTVAPAAAVVGDAMSAVVVLVLDAVIVSVTALDVDVANPALPEYTAVMLSGPTARLLVVYVATPELFTVPVPSSVDPL